MYKGSHWINLITLSTLLIYSRCATATGRDSPSSLDVYDRREDIIPYLDQIDDFFPSIPEFLPLEDLDEDLLLPDYPLTVSGERQQLDATEILEIYQQPGRREDLKSPPQTIKETERSSKDFFDIPLRKSIQVSNLNKNIQTTGFINSRTSPNFAERLSPNQISPPKASIDVPNEPNVESSASQLNKTAFLNSWKPNDVRHFTFEDGSRFNKKLLVGNSVLARKQFSVDPVATLVRSKFKFEMSDSPQAKLNIPNKSSTSATDAPQIKPVNNIQDRQSTNQSLTRKQPKFSQQLQPDSSLFPTSSPIRNAPNPNLVMRTVDYNTTFQDSRKVVYQPLGNPNTSSTFSSVLSTNNSKDKSNENQQKLLKRISTDLPSSTLPKPSE